VETVEKGYLPAKLISVRKQLRRIGMLKGRVFEKVEFYLSGAKETCMGGEKTTKWSNWKDIVWVIDPQKAEPHPVKGGGGDVRKRKPHFLRENIPTVGNCLHLERNKSLERFGY